MTLQIRPARADDVDAMRRLIDGYAAQDLMLSTNDPLAQVAVACGFSDQSHFSRQFRRALGETPNAWRRRNVTQAQAIKPTH